MRSRHADKFNHDEDAAGYDQDVADEGNPIRAGYSALLDWVVAEAAVSAESAVLELGTGTGNLAVRLGGCRRLVCVDVSAKMLDIARVKLAGREGVDFVQDDLLGCFESLEGPFDAIVSTYAIHHLTEPEKAHLLDAAVGALAPGGRLVCGDLMFESDEQRGHYLAKLRAEGRDDLAEDVADEFFWNLKAAVEQLESAGLQIATTQVSELSRGLSARRPIGSADPQ